MGKLMRPTGLTLKQTLFYGLTMTCILCIALYCFGVSIGAALLFSWIASAVVIPATAWAILTAQRHINILDEEGRKITEEAQFDMGVAQE